MGDTSLSTRCVYRHRRGFWYLSGLTLVAGAVLLGLYFTLLPAAFPKLQVPEYVDAGRIDRGDPCSCQFEAKNEGQLPLIIHKAKASCHCQGVYVLRPNGVREPIRELRIAPGKSITLGTRFVATGMVNEPVSFQVLLATNDPVRAIVEIRINYTPSAKIYCVPNVLVFGEVPLATTVTRIIKVFADDRAGKVDAKELSFTLPEFFKIQFVPNQHIRSGFSSSIPVKIGEFHLIFNSPSESRNINEHLQILKSGKELFQLPVTAQCVPPFRLTPAKVVLPRYSEGSCLYDYNVFARSITKPFTLRVRKQPTHVKVTISEANLGLTQKINISCKRGAFNRKKTDPLTETIELIASTGLDSVALSFEVIILPPEFLRPWLLSSHSAMSELRRSRDASRRRIGGMGAQRNTL